MTVTLDDIVRRLDDHGVRIDRLEHQQTQPAPARKKLSSVVPDDVIDLREALWWEYLDADLTVASPDSPVTKKGRKLQFAIDHNLNPSEFNRWFTRAPRKQIAHGSQQDQNIRRALGEAIQERRTNAHGSRSFP
jgi:hypothetical protein